MEQLLSLSIVLRLHLVRSGDDPMEEPGQRRGGDTGEGERLVQALPEGDKGTDLRVVRQAGIGRRLVGMVQHVHYVRTAYPWRIVEPGMFESARLQVGYALPGPVRHVGLRP